MSTVASDTMPTDAHLAWPFDDTRSADPADPTSDHGYESDDRALEVPQPTRPPHSSITPHILGWPAVWE